MKPRLDELLVSRGLFETVHDARAAVLAGEVVVGEHRETSAGRRLSPDAPLRVKGSRAFASRGGSKLAKALDAFGLTVQGLSCIDLGASTGGFTDCLLKNGAAHVCAVDVGAPLMRWELQMDERVDYRSSTDVRGFDPLGAGGPFDVAVADLSFISLTGLFDDIARVLKPGGVLVSLVKPQFEVARDDVGEGGVVRDASLHAQAVEHVLASAAASGLAPRGLTFSPITGRKGNIEYLFWAVKGPRPDGGVDAGQIAQVVQDAHRQLGGSQ